MENLRWILIFAGVAILVLLYFSGRQSKGSRQSNQSKALGRDSHRSSQESIDPLMSDDSFPDPIDDFGMDDDLERPGGRPVDRSAGQGSAENSRASNSLQSSAVGGFGSISSKIKELGSKLPSSRGTRPSAESDGGNKSKRDAQASKIVTLHVVAPEGQLMNGGHLLEQFEQRGYHYGDMNIFHSMHEGKTVFSVAKLVVPGTFDINDVDSFQTPGISLILQLPGPVAADVAFEVLLSEAHEIADTLGATVLDADRSTLSKQTVQHMREGISEYMHRQKHFSGVPS